MKEKRMTKDEENQSPTKTAPGLTNEMMKNI